MCSKGPGKQSKELCTSLTRPQWLLRAWIWPELGVGFGTNNRKEQIISVKASAKTPSSDPKEGWGKRERERASEGD